MPQPLDTADCGRETGPTWSFDVAPDGEVVHFDDQGSWPHYVVCDGPKRYRVVPLVDGGTA